MNAQPEETAARKPAIMMADTVRPAMIPAGWPHAVLAYRDGGYAWPEDQMHRFGQLIGISVTGDPAMAAHAREVDVERYDATPEHAPAFLDARARLGHHDGTVYCDRATLPAIFAHLGHRRPRLHVATLDSHLWTPHELAANIQARWPVPVSLDELTAMIWAIQAYPADPGAGIYWDTSLIYGTPDFWNPGRRKPAAAAIPMGGHDSPYLTAEGIRTRSMHLLDDLAVFLRGSGDSFTGDLLRLMVRSDPGNRQRLAAAYPVEHEALEAWQHLRTGEPPTFGELADHLAAVHLAGVEG